MPQSCWLIVGVQKSQNLNFLANIDDLVCIEAKKRATHDFVKF